MDYRGARTGTNKDAVGSEIIRNRIKGYQYVGGLFGYQGQSTENIIYCEIYNSDIECNYESAGPYAGGGSWNYPKYLISEDNKVSSMMNCAGGVSGEVGDGYNMLINHVTVSGSDYIGGVYGNIRTRIPIAHWLRIPQSAVPAMWEDIPVIRIQIIQVDLPILVCTTLKLKQQETMPEASSEWYGRILSKVFCQQGGCFGECLCRWSGGRSLLRRYFGNIINANVTATLGAGGVSGRMFSLGYFASAPSSYPDTRVKRTIVTGTVSASSDRAGGLTGEFVRGMTDTVQMVF